MWKISRVEVDQIKEAAQAASGVSRVILEPGIRYNLHDDRESVNILLVTDRPEDWDDTDLACHAEILKAGQEFPLTDKGCAVIDIYVYSKEGLETNVVVYYASGKITEMRDVHDRIIFKA